MSCSGSFGSTRRIESHGERMRLTIGDNNVDWAATLDFVSHGVRLKVRSDDARVLERLIPHLPPDRTNATGDEADVVLSVVTVGGDTPPEYRLLDGETLALETSELDRLVDRFASSIHHHVAVHARDRLFVHAGVVGWRGHAILLPGRSRTGKSTLVRALVQMGAAYYSDEYAAFDEAGLVHPYPKLLAIRGDDGSPRQWCSAEALGGHSGSEPLPVGLIAVAQYQRGAAWAPDRLVPGRAVLAMLDNTVLAQARAQAALRTLGRVVSDAPTLAGTRGEAQEASAALLRYMDAVTQ